VSLEPLRAVRRASVLAAVAVAVAAAPASARLYVSTTVDLTGAEPAGTIEGYAYVLNAANADSFRLDVERDGAPVASATGQSVVLLSPFVARTGDRITLTDETTSESRTVTYDGRPAFDASICGAATTFGGDRDEGATVSVGAALSFGAGDPRNAALTVPSLFGPGTRFSGSFPTALAAGWTISAQQVRALDPGFTALNALSRRLGDCPPTPSAPPAPEPAPDPAPSAPAPPAAKDLLPPAARLTMPGRLLTPVGAYRALLAGRFSGRVSVSEPATVTQRLYADDGAALPKATATAKRRLTVLGTGQAAAAAPGGVSVVVRLSVTGRAALRRRTPTRVALVTTVVDAAGNARVLSPKRFTVLRPR
jgi:hypothetical protein